MLKEIQSLVDRGVNVRANLMLSDRAHVVMPWHMIEDRILNEGTADGENIGTTLRGIGPCYRDKVGRSHAVRLGDLFRPEFPERVRRICEAKRQVLGGMSREPLSDQLDPAAVARDFLAFAERLKPYVADTTAYLLDAVEQGKRLLFEGAQGSLLDVDHGTYPFVTSSNSSGVGIASGSGVPGRWISKVIGVAKAYSTRVGGGPFPTEQDNETGERIRKTGREYGTTTGRPRRCGWFDAVAVRYAARLSGIDVIALMMLDVLSCVSEIRICTAYDVDGKRIRQFPSHVDDLRRAQPVYETLPGWNVDISGARRMEELPPEAHTYLRRIEELIERPVEYVSIGPDREQTIFRNLAASAS